jgi:hypothetical protein
LLLDAADDADETRRFFDMSIFGDSIAELQKGRVSSTETPRTDDSGGTTGFLRNCERFACVGK